MRRPLKAILTVIAACALLPATAAATAGGQAVIKDCVDNGGTLTKVHRAADYSWALAHMQADVLQYTDCADAIAAAARAAKLSHAKPGTQAGAGTDSSWGTNTGVPGVPPGTNPLSTIKPAEQAGIAKKVASGAAEPVIVAGRPIVPEATTGSLVSRLSRLPDPVLALVIAMSALAVLALGLTGLHSYRNVRKHRSSDRP